MKKNGGSMTVKDVRVRIKAIRAVQDDDETAHAMEDELRTDVLIAIRYDPTNAADLAAETLKTADITFSRWCA